MSAKAQNRLPLIIITIAIVVGIGAMLMGDPLKRSERDIAAQYNENLERFKYVEPALLTYTERESISLDMKTPRAIALGKGGRIYVAGDSRVAIFSATGTFKRNLTAAAPLRAVAVHENNTVYAATHDRILVFDAAGKRLAEWSPLSASPLISALVVTKDRLYIANAARRQVVWFDLQGKPGDIVGRTAQNPDGARFRLPSPRLDLALDPTGKLVVNNPGRHRIEVFGADNTRTLSFGKDGFYIDGYSGCCNPTHLAVLPEGNFLTSEKGIPRVKVQDSTGKILAVVAPPSAFDDDVVGLDLAVSPQGVIYILDPERKAVRLFAKK